MYAIEVMNSIGVMYSNEVMNSRDELKCLKVKLQWFCSYSFFVLYSWCLRLVKAQKGRMTKTAVK